MRAGLDEEVGPEFEGSEGPPGAYEVAQVLLGVLVSIGTTPLSSGRARS